MRGSIGWLAERKSARAGSSAVKPKGADWTIWPFTMSLYDGGVGYIYNTYNGFEKSENSTYYGTAFNVDAFFNTYVNPIPEPLHMGDDAGRLRGPRLRRVSSGSSGAKQVQLAG
jgi:hypothetical protein